MPPSTGSRRSLTGWRWAAAREKGHSADCLHRLDDSVFEGRVVWPVLREPSLATIASTLPGAARRGPPKQGQTGRHVMRKVAALAVVLGCFCVFGSIASAQEKKAPAAKGPAAAKKPMHVIMSEADIKW